MEQQNLERRTDGRVTITPELATAASLLAHDVPNFVREAFHLGRLEARKTARAVGVRASIVSTSLYFAMVGLLFICAGLSFLISEATQRPWLGPLLVGGGLVVIAGIAAPIALVAGRAKSR